MKQKLKINTLFEYINKNKVVTIEEIKKEFQVSSKSILKYYLTKLKGFNIIKLKRGIYAKSEQIDPYLVVSKIHPKNILAYHTALELHGYGHSTYYTYYVFNPINKKQVTLHGFFVEFVKPTLQHYTVINSIKVTDLEQTILDGLNKLNYVGGFEEFYKCLESIKKINFRKLLRYLEEYNKKYLYNSCGFLFELLNLNNLLVLPKDFLKKLEKEKRKTTVFLEESNSKKYDYNKKWNIKIPIELKSLIEHNY